MKFGLWYAAVGPYALPEGAAAIARAAERAGFDSLWTGEHIVVPAGYRSVYPYSDNGRMAGDGAVPMAEPLLWFAHVGALTERILLVPGVLIVPQRNPVILAKQAATLAVLSNGRFRLGAGTGWLREEFDALGVPFDRRGERLDEYIDAMRVLWREPLATYDGDFVSFTDAQLYPKPPGGTVPVVIGGHSAHAARRAGRLGDGFFPAKGSREELARLFELVRATAEAHGRDPAAIELTVADESVKGPGGLEVVDAWEALGVDRILVNPPGFDVDGIGYLLASFGEEVIAHAA